MSGSLTPWDGTEQLSEVLGPCRAVGATQGDGQGRRALSLASPHTLQPCSPASIPASLPPLLCAAYHLQEVGVGRALGAEGWWEGPECCP